MGESRNSAQTCEGKLYKTQDHFSKLYLTKQEPASLSQCIDPGTQPGDRWQIPGYAGLWSIDYYEQVMQQTVHYQSNQEMHGLVIRLVTASVPDSSELSGRPII